MQGNKLGALVAAAALHGFFGCGPLEEEESVDDTVAVAVGDGPGGVRTDLFEVIDCTRIRCDRPNDTSSFESGSFQSFTCVWNCIEFEGSADRYVSLTFVPSDGCWELDQVFESFGVCP